MEGDKKEILGYPKYLGVAFVIGKIRKKNLGMVE